MGKNWDVFVHQTSSQLFVRLCLEREEKRNTILTIVYFSPCLLLLHSQDRPASALPHHLLLLHFNEKNLDDEIFFSIKKTLIYSLYISVKRGGKCTGYEFMMDISTLNFGVWLLLMQYIVEVIAMLHKIEVCFNLVEKSQLTSQSIISAHHAAFYVCRNIYFYKCILMICSYSGNVH